ncbi:50S ribosomal protein L24 [Nitrosovibrio sp. Nv6]|uniref:50S ribosomal protein L24 n=1 Tax=Nitrosovibrio sp. Nv6 TaxID=1855340 RepID=UPI0008B8A8B8|nr:50S ribosomal protein L24 [Nitrosovibrio sp. Nv6]SEP30135.1 large subunit ribosomal protein L24 [Nitrosovibrio sp. Nv6]
MRKIKKGDDVIVITGRDKGKRGTVLRIVNADLVVIEGANKVKKHQRPNPSKGTAGGIVEMENPIQVSNVAIYNPATRKADRVGFRILEGKGKVRYFKSSGELLDA